MIDDSVSGKEVFEALLRAQQSRLEQTLLNFDLKDKELVPKTCDVCPEGREARGTNQYPTGAIYEVSPDFFSQLENYLILFSGERTPEYRVRNAQDTVDLFQRFQDDDVALAYCPELNSVKRFKMMVVPPVQGLDVRSYFPEEKIERQQGLYDIGCKSRLVAFGLAGYPGLRNVSLIKQTVDGNLGLGGLAYVNKDGSQAELTISQPETPEDPTMTFANPELFQFNGHVTLYGRRFARNTGGIVVPTETYKSSDISDMARFLTETPNRPLPTKIYSTPKYLHAG
jgi:hypothetical protein